jgi:cytochrome P450
MATFLETSSPSTVAATCFGGIFLLYQLIQHAILANTRRAFKRSKGCGDLPSYPHKDPILGLDLFFLNMKLLKSGSFMPEVRKRFVWMKHHTFSQILMGNQVINTTDPENIKAMLATQFKDFGMPTIRKNALQPVFGHGIFTTDGKEWETSRSLLRPNFTRSQVGDLETFETHISKLITKIPRDQSTVDLQELFFKLTLDSATEFLFGQSTDVLGASPERGERFADAFTYVTERLGLETRLGPWATILPNKRYKEDVKTIHEYISGYVQDAVASYKSGTPIKKDGNADRYVFLEELAKLGCSERKIQDELLNILLAGRDTTASLLSYLFYILARRPDVFSKLRAEVMQYGNQPPTFEQVKSMKYLQYCLNEGKHSRVLAVVYLANMTSSPAPSGGSRKRTNSARGHHSSRWGRSGRQIPHIR